MDQTIQDFLTNPVAQISIGDFMINMVLATILSLFIRFMYIRYGTALSNRRSFAQNFTLIILTTTLIITVVKSSLALSLGLVGALSIVRFRTAIKEPEELAYLFLAIAVGLGLGADQRVVTVIAFLIIAAVIWIRNKTRQMEENQNIHLTISSHNPQKVDLEAIVQVLYLHCSEVDLKRIDESPELLEAIFLIEFEDFVHLLGAKSDLQKLNDSLSLTFLDSRGLTAIA